MRVKLSLDEIASATLAGEVTVAVRSNSVVGYFLAPGSIRELESTGYLREQGKLCVYRGKPISEYDTCYGAQVCVDEAFRGLGLGKLLLQHASHMLKNKYNIIMSSISKENEVGLAYNININGWAVVSEDSDRLFVVYDLHHSGRSGK